MLRLCSFPFGVYVLWRGGGGGVGGGGLLCRFLTPLCNHDCAPQSVEVERCVPQQSFANILPTHPPSLPIPLQCSVSCGRGTKQRDVACVHQNQTEIEEEHCGHLPRPRTQKACRARGCPGWKANRWTEVCLLFFFLPISSIAPRWGPLSQ